MKRHFYRPRLLREYIRAIFCQECGLSSAWSALRGCFIQRMRLHLPEMGLEKVPSRNASLRYPKMRFEDASPRAFRLRRRKGDDYCRVQPTSVCLFGAVGLWAMRSFGHRMSPLTRMAAERAEHEQVQVRVRVRARMPLLPPVLRGFGGRRHRGVSSLRALTAAMRIARKRNRSPQNGAGRDDGSSQRSLL